MSLTAFLRRVIEILDEAGVPYMLTGSLASAYYAIPRATQHLDVVIATEEVGVEEIVQGLQNAEWNVDRDAALEAHRTRGQFNAVDPSSGWKVDFIIRKDRTYSRTELDRRKRVSLLYLEVSIASLEDILIAKLEWSRLGDPALQRQDVLQLLERAWERLDRDYVEMWVAELGLTSEWEDARRKVTKGEDKAGADAARWPATSHNQGLRLRPPAAASVPTGRGQVEEPNSVARLREQQCVSNRSLAGSEPSER